MSAQGNREFSFNLGLGASATVAIQDPDIASEFYKLYNAINLLASKLDEYTGAIPVGLADRPYTSAAKANRAGFVNRLYGEATVTLAAGTVVAFDSTGKLVLASSTVKAHAIVLEDTALGNFAPVAVNAVVGLFSGLVAGSLYYVSTTVPGAVALSGTQVVGFAVNSHTLAFYPQW